MKVSVPVLAAAAILAVIAVPAAAADFDCTTAETTSERAICSSEQLSRLDERMARLYGWLWTSMSDDQRQQLRGEQRRFLAFRDACGVDKICLRTSYLTRIDDLDGKLRQVTQSRQES